MAAAWEDHIGDRLDHPERVPEEYQHLIPDDLKRVEWILDHQVSGRVLDVGCSDGAISGRIKRKWPIQLEVCDISLSPAILETQAGFDWDIREPAYLRCQYYQYDAVFCTEVLEHLFPYESLRALANLWEILKPGGRLIVTVPNRAWPSTELRQRWAWPNHRQYLRQRWAWPDHRQYFDLDCLRPVLRQQFACVRVEPIVEGIWLGAVCTK